MTASSPTPSEASTTVLDQVQENSDHENMCFNAIWHPPSRHSPTPFPHAERSYYASSTTTNIPRVIIPPLTQPSSSKIIRSKTPLSTVSEFSSFISPISYHSKPPSPVSISTSDSFIATSSSVTSPVTSLTHTSDSIPISSIPPVGLVGSITSQVISIDHAQKESERKKKKKRENRRRQQKIKRIKKRLNRQEKQNDDINTTNNMRQDHSIGSNNQNVYNHVTVHLHLSS